MRCNLLCIFLSTGSRGLLNYVGPRGDSGCPCVQRVIEKLTHDGRWPLHHFPSGDLADQLIRQLADGVADGVVMGLIEEGVHTTILIF